MKIKFCGLGHRVFGQYGASWLRGKKRMKGDGTSGTESYMTHIANAASFAAFERDREGHALLSAEALPENASLVDFSTFATEYPDKLFPLLDKLRPEFREYFIEYYILHKPQSFIGKTHGCIQTRVWQSLRIIEQTIGAFIILGVSPDASVLRPIIKKANLETTPYGSLTQLILSYASSQNYAVVAKSVGSPAPAIRKIFRPAITSLLAAKDVHAVAVGAYLRNLTHQASLTSAGLSKRCVARTRRVKNLKFDAPPADDSPLLSFGPVASLQDTPWNMFEISSDMRMNRISPVLKKEGRRLFGKKAAQIFAPVNADGELEFNYIFARSTSPFHTRALTRIRGISEMASIYNEEGTFVQAVTVPHADVQVMMDKHTPPKIVKCRTGQFVQISSGQASRYHGTITKMTKGHVFVRVDFPTGRCFLIDAHPSSVVPVDVPIIKRRFWGIRI